MDGTELESSDEEKISLQKFSKAKIQKERKETEKYQILTRSKALIDAVEDEDSSDEEGNERIIMVEEALMGNPTSFYKAYNHEDSEKGRDGEKQSRRRYLTWKNVKYET
jgi:hypothetical protein